METSKGFDAYEIIGIIAPGTVVALMVAFELPQLRSLLGSDGLNIGDFGLFVLLAFVLGHLVQAFGNAIERIVWPFSGLPTDQMRSTSQTYLSEAQRNTLMTRVALMEGASVDLPKMPTKTWRAVTARMYTRVNNAGRSGRIDVANRTYGLFRGLVAALSLALAWCVYAHWDQRGLLLALALMIAAAVWRMRRAGYHYGRALFIEFIELEGPQ